MTIRILKTRHFQRWMNKAGLSDEMLVVAVLEMVAGLVDADLGGGVLKKRIALSGRGKRGSVRTLIATRWADRWIFVFGFEKKQRSNVSAEELKALRVLADELLGLSTAQLELAKRESELMEVEYGREDKS